MIDWISMIFFQLDNLGLLNVERMITALVLLLACRGLYVFFHFLNYSNDYNNELDQDVKLFTRNETILFGLRQIALLFVGMLYLPIAVFISSYSILICGSYLRQISVKRNISHLSIVGSLLNIIAPLIGFLWFVGDIQSIIAIGISLLAFLHHGQTSSSLSLSKVIENNQQRFNRVPKALYIGILIILIVIPSIILLGVVAYSPPEKKTYYIEMRDGIKLATDVYLTPGSFGQPRPVILARTPYGKNSMGGMYGMLYLTQGYHMVVQDCRGTYDSDDHEDFMMFQQAYQDGVDTIDWILEQSWCNGKIASVGASALAINEFFYAGMNPKGLECQSLMIGTPDLYKTSIWPGGAFRESLATGWLEGAADNYEYQLQRIIDYPKKEDINYNSTSMFLAEGPNFGHVNVPAIHVGGWYDVFQQGTLDGFMGYDDLSLEGARGKQLLIMGPFTHGFPGEGQQGELFFPTGEYKGFDLYLEWEQRLFDHVLMGKDFDWSEPRVAYYMMGDVNDTSSEGINDYQFASDWPVPYVNDTWYFIDGGQLVKGSSGANRNYSYIYDPRDPVPTLGGTNLMIAPGPYDQRSAESRSDVLIFETPVLTSSIDVIGHMWANLWITSNCSNTDFTVKITDVYPNGQSMLLTDGIINAIRRDGFDKDAAPLNSSQPVKVTIDLWSTAYQFGVGHKIRVAISSSNYPRFAINPNTGTPPKLYSYQYLNQNIANNTILVGPDYPSHIILPRPTSS